MNPWSEGAPAVFSSFGIAAHRFQEKVDVAGVHVVAYELSDLSYAAEIAAQMLVRQQAQARAPPAAAAAVAAVAEVA